MHTRDLQWMTMSDTYAATLMMKSLWAIIAIAAQFDLEIEYWDVLNASYTAI